MMISGLCHHDGWFSSLCENLFDSQMFLGEITKLGKMSLKENFGKKYVLLHITLLTFLPNMGFASKFWTRIWIKKN